MRLLSSWGTCMDTGKPVIASSVSCILAAGLKHANHGLAVASNAEQAWQHNPRSPRPTSLQACSPSAQHPSCLQTLATNNPYASWSGSSAAPCNVRSDDTSCLPQHVYDPCYVSRCQSAARVSSKMAKRFLGSTDGLVGEKCIAIAVTRRHGRTVVAASMVGFTHNTHIHQSGIYWHMRYCVSVVTWVS